MGILLRILTVWLVIFSLIVLVQEYFDACQSASGPSVPVAPMHWTRPPDGLYKVNFDAALFEGSGCASIGVAI